MAVVSLFAVYDLKSESFGPLLGFNTVGLARRFLEDEVKNPQSLIARHPEDFDLREIGTFDTSNGAIEVLTVPKQVARATDFMEKK